MPQLSEPTLVTVAHHLHAFFRALLFSTSSPTTTTTATTTAISSVFTAYQKVFLLIKEKSLSFAPDLQGPHLRVQLPTHTDTHTHTHTTDTSRRVDERPWSSFFLFVFLLITTNRSFVCLPFFCFVIKLSHPPFVWKKELTSGHASCSHSKQNTQPPAPTPFPPFFCWRKIKTMTECAKSRTNYIFGFDCQ